MNRFAHDTSRGVSKGNDYKAHNGEIVCPMMEFDYLNGIVRLLSKVVSSE